MDKVVSLGVGDDNAYDGIFTEGVAQLVHTGIVIVPESPVKSFHISLQTDIFNPDIDLFRIKESGSNLEMAFDPTVIVYGSAVVCIHYFKTAIGGINNYNIVSTAAVCDTAPPLAVPEFGFPIRIGYDKFIFEITFNAVISIIDHKVFFEF
jgi:hypothetical protein